MIAQRVEFGSNRFGLWQLGVNIAFLDDELTAHFCCGQPGIKPVVAKLRVGLALPIHDFFDVCKQMGRRSSAGLRPRKAKASWQVIPAVSS